MLNHRRVDAGGNKDERSLGNAVQGGGGNSDNIIPLLSFFQCLFPVCNCGNDMIALNSRPSEWRVGTSCTCVPFCTSCLCFSPYYVWNCGGIRLSDVQGECCLLWDSSIRQVQPEACCRCWGDVLFAQFRYDWPKIVDYKNAPPCVFNLGGCNICLDGNFRCGFLQSIKTLKEGEWCLPFCPCVVGSWYNCKILFDCFAACAELCSVLAAGKFMDGGKSKDKTPATANDASSPEEGEPLKAEVMARQALETGSKMAMDELRKLGNRGKDQIGKTKTADLYPCLALFCCIESLFMKFPECLGCYSESVCVGCFNTSCTCCKPMIIKGEIFTGDIELICSARQGCTWPRTCCACIWQPNCIDSRCALPCDGQDVPCMLNICWINLCYKFRPTFHCTWWAPIAQFQEGYQGEKYTVGRMICITWRFVCAKLSSCKNDNDDALDDEPKTDAI